MKTDRNAANAQVYAALDSFRAVSLRELRSSFLAPDDPDAHRVWTPESARELVNEFVEKPDESSRSFIEKLKGQLAGVSRPAGQLMEELAWLHLVVASASKQGYASKRQLLDDIATVGHATAPSGVFDEALHFGLASPGTSFFTRRPNQLWLLVRFAERWTSASPTERERWLDEPSAFRAMVLDLPGVADQTQRHALLHLVHPDVFEDTVSQYHKRDIAALATEGESGPDVDATIANVRRRLSAEFGDRFSFYSSDVRSLWDSEPQPEAKTTQAGDEEPDDSSVSDRETQVRGAWLVRGSGGERVPEWLEQGICGIDFADTFPFELTPGLSRDELRAAADEAGIDTMAGSFSNELGQVWRFVNMVEVGDYVVTVNGQHLFLGVVNSGPRDIFARTRKQTVRDVEWLNAGDPVERRTIAKTLQAKMKTLLTVSLISSEIDELERWLSSAAPPDAPAAPESTALPRSTDQLQSDLLLPREWLDEIIDLLDEKRQIVLYGPPGTGKTFLAQALADHFSGSGGTSELVQFHPSYTYEDFFEGYRPVLGVSGKVEFEVKSGPLRRIAEAASASPTVPHVLIIDEINRGNLAKIFGELYFLLEYRDNPISLQYSDQEFTLPQNLFVIGTMNTADRSIALVDAAMRRRFYFVELAPSVAPIDDLLDRWLARRSLPDLPARLLAELNRRLADPDAAIGPSYFMTDEIMKPGRLERIWNHAILPLLEERFYGSPDALAQFSYTAVLGAVAQGES